MDPEQLYETCFMQVYSYVMTLCADRGMAEEITQETFYRAISAGEHSRFRAQADQLTWLCAIAKNLFADELRRRKRTAELDPEILSGEDLTERTEKEDLSFRIHVALHALEEPYREVFQLRVFGELPFARIGQLFGRTETWARVTYHRARIKLRERMGSDESDE